MRPMAYLAAAAVGLITPVAFAVPALAQIDDDTVDGRGNITITAETEGENGEVTFTIEGSDLNPSSDIEITSSDVDQACASNNLDGVTETTDEEGNLDLTVSANDCEPGSYTVEFAELEEPSETFSETVTID